MSKPNHCSRRARGALRTLRISRAAGTCLVALALLPGVAVAVQVVDVRVGQHERYTRLVFELDEPAGYRVTRAGKTLNPGQLEISLDAEVQPSRFSFRDGWIEKVDVKPRDGRTAAEIVLRKPGLRLREMTLIEPFRVVIDVLAPPAPAPVAAKKKAPKKLAATPLAPKAAPAKKTAKPAPAAKPAVATRAAPAASKPKPAAVAKPAPLEIAQVEKAKPVAKSSAAPVAAPRPSASRAQTPAPPKVRPPQPKPAPSRTAPEPPVEEGGFPWLFAGVGLLVILAGVAYAASRRRGGTGFDESDFEDLVPEPDGSPFSALSSEAGTDASEPETESQTETVEIQDSQVPRVEDIAEPIVELEPPVDTAADSLPVLEGVPVEDPAEAGFEPAATAMADDFTRVLKEIESRLSALEGRLDEFVEWKSRVEMQITAQTEELRVQRAAIARTQRAVRQMSRPQEVEPGGASEPQPASESSEG